MVTNSRLYRDGYYKRCEWDGCHEAASSYWEAQWTLFDFGEYGACEEHLMDVGKALAARTVYGQPIMTLLPHYAWER